MGFREPGPFSLLPRSRTPWSEFVCSYGLQAVAVGVFVWIPVLHPEVLDASKHDYLTIALVPTPTAENHAPQRRLPSPVVVARPDPAPAALQLLAAAPKPKVEDVPAPVVKIAERKLDPLPATEVPIIPRIVRTNVFASGTSSPQTIDRAPERVQTGGFGDPNGVQAKTSPTQAVNIARAGGFDMPAGPGSGNGTGGSTGAKGVIASSGFGSGVAAEQSAYGPQGAVQQTAFGDMAAPAVQARQVLTAAAKITPAEILSKPVPVYTDEARARRIEGEVLLEVVLEATGKLHVVRVVRGLGHGLDDAAVRAAEQIHFKPAQRNGQPSDSTAVLHIIFQMA